MKLTMECEQELDGRWSAEVPQLPGAMAYGSSAAEALACAAVLALRVIADRLENGEIKPLDVELLIPAMA